MSAVHKLNNFIAAFVDALKSMFYLRLWAPIFIFAVISLIAVYKILHPFNPLWSWVLLPLGQLKFFGGGEGFAHYPQHLLLAPSVYFRMNMIASVLFDSVLAGTAFLMFARFFSGDKVKFFQSFRDALRKYLLLAVSYIVIYAILLLVSLLVQSIVSDFLIGSPRRQLAFSIGFNFVLFGILSPFVYVVPFIVLKNRNIITAFVRSIKFWFKNFFTTYFVIFISQIIVLPFSVALDFKFRLSLEFSPNIVQWLLYGQIVAYMIASFLMVAMLTRHFIEYNE